MKQTSIVVKCQACPNGAATVLAYEDSLWPGLVVNRAHAHVGDHVPSEQEMVALRLPAWLITHTPSGVAMPVGFLAREPAEVILGLLGDIPGADWTKSMPELQSPVLKVAMAAVFEQAQQLGTGLASGPVDMDDLR